ncbi:MAG: EutN/CcmL family microcompartment protein [Actinobacteria bacterium]|nr:EutN/CcmL family microcompartment protein [Actinomycetota bacterium]
MRLAKVIGNAVSVSKHEKLEGIKLQIIKPIDPEGKKISKPIIVADYLNSAAGSLVYWIEDGVTICKWMGIKSIPLRGSILGQIDRIDLKDKTIKG